MGLCAPHTHSGTSACSLAGGSSWQHLQKVRCASRTLTLPGGEVAAMTLHFPTYVSSRPLSWTRWQTESARLINTPGVFLSPRALWASLARLGPVGVPSALCWLSWGQAQGPALGRKMGERTDGCDRDRNWMVLRSFRKFKFRGEAQTCTHAYETASRVTLATKEPGTAEWEMGFPNFMLNVGPATSLPLLLPLLPGGGVTRIQPPLLEGAQTTALRGPLTRQTSNKTWWHLCFGAES